MKIRRVVTSRDDAGAAQVAIDEVSRDVVSFRPGATVANIWSTAGFPVDNNGLRDTAKEITATTRAGGTVFRVIEFAPGVAPRNHRTDSIDYAVVLSGEIEMTLDDQVVTPARRRRAGAARHHPQLDQPVRRALRDRLRADRCQAGRHDGRPLAAPRLARDKTKQFPGSQYGEEWRAANRGSGEAQYRPFLAGPSPGTRCSALIWVAIAGPGLPAHGMSPSCVRAPSPSPTAPSPVG